MSWKVRLPMMCRLASHTVLTVQAAASSSCVSKIHLAPPSSLATKPSIDTDIFKISSLIVSSGLLARTTNQTDQFRPIAPDFGPCDHRNVTAFLNASVIKDVRADTERSGRSEIGRILTQRTGRSPTFAVGRLRNSVSRGSLSPLLLRACLLPFQLSLQMRVVTCRFVCVAFGRYLH